MIFFFGLCPLSNYQCGTTFQTPVLLLSSGEGQHIIWWTFLLSVTGPVTANSSKVSIWLGAFLYLKMEAELASEILYYIESLTMDEVHRKMITSVSRTPMSQHYRVGILLVRSTSKNYCSSTATCHI